MKDGAILTFEPRLAFNLLWRIPFVYVIRLFTWGYESHIAVVLDGKICEQTAALGYSERPINQRLAIVPKNLNVYAREPINSLSIEQIAAMRDLCKREHYVKYGLGAAAFTAINSIPLLNKINFGRKKSACSIFASYFLKVGNLLPRRIDPYNTNPKELVKRLDKYGHYHKKRRIV